ncbi:IPTL-CTERM sorting domain-containing protein [Comamonas serinivorans]|uniref:IPTL-CTERM sorting domain-containing protein n=1 Tax=Comamonas serinivorans TaxID=1082851 RepID=UPI0012F75429|nr:IPTL-CTERM sorting domain-containing protein [Comamonas serinivorans]
MRSLLLVGLLSAQGVWAGTWNLTFTPQQTLDTPPEPVFSWTPPAGTRFGGTITCSGGTIAVNPANGVFAVPFATDQAFVEFANIFTAPSTVAVTVTPDTAGGTANCRLNPSVQSFDETSGNPPMWNVPSTVHDGYVRLIGAIFDGTNYSLDTTLPANATSGGFFQENPNFLDANTITTGIAPVGITDSGTATSNVFVNAKTTSATVAFELTNPQPTDSTITFTVQETPQTYEDDGGNTVYDPGADGYQPTYGTPTTITVTIPAGSTTVSVPIPNILPGSEVTITPTDYPGGIVGTPILVKTSPLPLATAGPDPFPLTNVVATPDTAGPFTTTVPTNVIDFQVVLDVPPVVTPPTTPKPVPTLGEWGLGLLGTLLAGFAAWRRPTHRRS